MLDVSVTSDASVCIPFDASAIRRRYAAAFKPKAWIYWADLCVSALVGWSAFALAIGHPFGSPAHVVWAAVATLALLRAALFIHELAHVKRGALPHFETVWHALVGLPLMLPSLMYVGSHHDHHRGRAFGTAGDPEYAPIAHWTRPQIVRFVVGVAFVPLVLPLRWGLVAPLSYAVPRLRRWAVERASTLVINTDYRRPMPQGAEAVRWRRQEMAACALFWLVAAGLWQGLVPLSAIATWLCVAAGILVINQVRTLAAHRYENEGEEVDAQGQLMDSINLRGVPVLTALIAPVGLRYHALHHFLPAVPYHSLGRLHRQLVSELPREAAYHRTEADGVLLQVRNLWRKAPA